MARAARVLAFSFRSEAISQSGTSFCNKKSVCPTFLGFHQKTSEAKCVFALILYTYKVTRHMDPVFLLESVFLFSKPHSFKFVTLPIVQVLIIK